jgi:hypothetical protein
MFSYTDDAIVTSSPTGRHLSTVIRRPAGMPDNGWTQHAEQVCKVLNELDRNARVCYSLGEGFQKVGRVKRDTELDEAVLRLYPDGPTAAAIREELRSAEPVPATPGERIAELEKQLDDATTKLCAAQMLLEQADGKVQKLETKLTEALGVRKVRVPMKSPLRARKLVRSGDAFR